MIDNDAVIDRLPKIGPTGVMVYLALARHTNDVGECWPSIDRIAEKAGVKRRAVQLALRKLEGDGIIEKTTQDGRPTIYKLRGAPGCAPAKQGGALECAPGAHVDARGGAPGCAKGAHLHAPKQETRTRPKNNGRATAKKFCKPTAEEVRAYCLERKNQVDPQRFVDYYKSNGWRVGRNAMRDWQAAIRTWEKNGFSAGNGEAKKSEPIKYRA